MCTRRESALFDTNIHPMHMEGKGRIDDIDITVQDDNKLYNSTRSRGEPNLKDRRAEAQRQDLACRSLSGYHYQRAV